MLFKLCPWGKIDPAPGSQFNFELIEENFKQLLLLNRLWEFDKTQQE